VGHRGVAGAVSTAMALVLIATACTGGGKPRPSPTTIAAPIPSPSTESCVHPTPSDSQTEPKYGFSIVFGAEQWPDCLNPITSCAASNWTYFTVLQHVLPRAMQLDLSGTFTASPMLVEAPTLTNGELSQNPFIVRFRISPKALWEDGSPITGSDFSFTWRAIMNTTGAYDKHGYDLITSIDTTDLSTAVISFKDIYIDWPDLFGGARGFVLKEAAFPKFAGESKPNLRREMATAIPFSGGPFILKSWSEDQAVLIRNDHYFGKIPNFDQVTFVPRTDLGLEAQSLLTGEVGAIYPRPDSDLSLLDVEAICGPKVVGGEGTVAETLWFNHSIPPMNDPLVREALMYAIDRQKLVDELIKLNNPDAQVLNCGLLALPHQGPWCQTTPFVQFTYDPERAKSILESDGYDCSSTPCTKGGKRLVVTYSTLATNLRQTATQRLLIEAARPAGFALKVAGLVGGVICSVGLGSIDDCAMATDPSATQFLTCGQISKKANPDSEANFTGWCDPEADALMDASNRELDPEIRLQTLDLLYALEARDFVSLPLYVVPAVSGWRTDQIAGPIGLYNSSPYGLFFNMNEWSVAPA
jgi:peptide/nickel transport system substrate-binding protein